MKEIDIGESIERSTLEILLNQKKNISNTMTKFSYIETCLKNKGKFIVEKTMERFKISGNGITTTIATHTTKLSNKIIDLEQTINKAIINYDVEFKVLIANQRLQIAAETSNIFKDIFGQVILTLSQEKVNFQRGIDQFQAIGLETANLLMDIPILVNGINKKIKKTIKKREEKKNK
jgi:phenylalanyl-tRNA synthetase alpha subunit